MGVAAPFVLGFPPHSAGVDIAVFVSAVLTFLSLLDLWLIHNAEWEEHQVGVE